MYLEGKFQINPPLQAIHFAYLERFSRIRHVKRDVALLEKWKEFSRYVVHLRNTISAMLGFLSHCNPRHSC
jgi:hypothetical protein